MSTNEGRIDSIQALRGIAALSVVAFHFHQVGYKYVRPAAFLPDWLNLGLTGVDLFFVISGFVMVLVTRGRFARLGEVTRFAWHRATRIYPIYWLYFLLTLAAFLIHPAWVNASDGHEQGSDLLPSFFLLPTRHLPLVQVSWSLAYELWFYLVFSVLLFCRERWLPLLLLLWGGIVGAVNATADVDAMNPDLHVILNPLTFEFLFGASAALLMNVAAVRKVPSVLLLLIIIVVAAVGVPAVFRHEHLLEENDPIRAVMLGPLYATLVAAIALLEQKHDIRVPNLLRSLGDISYTAYLSHLLVIGLIGHLWMMLRHSSSNPRNDVILWPAMMAAVIVYSWLGYRFVEKPLIAYSQWLWKRITGGAATRRRVRHAIAPLSGNLADR